MQSVSTRPDRIPATLAGLQDLNSQILQSLQQQLQDHLTASHKHLRAQVSASIHPAPTPVAQQSVVSSSIWGK